MGRQTRQARRAQERRAQTRGHQAAKGPDRKWLLAGVAVVLAAVALLVVFNATNIGNNSATPTATAVPAASINGIGCNPGGEVVTYHQHAHLALIDKGKQVSIPALIGFNVTMTACSGFTLTRMKKALYTWRRRARSCRSWRHSSKYGASH